MTTTPRGPMPTTLPYPRRPKLRLAKLTRGRRVAPVGGTRVLNKPVLRKWYDTQDGRGQVWSLGPAAGEVWLVMPQPDGPNRMALAYVGGTRARIVRYVDTAVTT